MSKGVNDNRNFSLEEVGNNTGNLLFFEALKNICIRNNSSVFSLDDIIVSPV